MNKSYRISEKAIQDLENIWLYTLETWSEAQADKYYGMIMAKIEFIIQNFDCGISRDYIKFGYRSIAVQSHLIFYRRADDGIVEIVRILHQNMDIVNRLQNDYLFL